MLYLLWILPLLADHKSRSYLPWLLRLFAALCLLATGVQVWAQTQDQAVDFATQSIQLAMSDEPRSLNSIKAVDAFGIYIVEHIMDGLLRRDANHQLVPAVAERWEMHGTSARFWLRHNALWSDGRPVTAHDFVFAWRTVVDPATASEYASMMYVVKNGEAINSGKMPLAELGVKALDDYTLEVELEKPTGYFLQLMTFIVFFPAREDFYTAQHGRYFADVENMLFNGPFTLTKWVHGAALRLEKNPSYWNRDAVHLNLINIPYITNDSAARFSLFKDGKIAVEDGLVGIVTEQLHGALENRFRIHSHSDGSQFYVEFNLRPQRPTSNLNLRKAMQAVFDSQELVYKVLGIPGYIPGHSLFPVYLQGVKAKFRQEYPVPLPSLDLAQARRYLQKAKQELGVDNIPPLSILADNREINILQTQYLQSLFKRTLDIDLRVDVQSFKQRLDKMHTGSFDLVIAGWGPDYDDPMTFADLFASWNGNNHGLYNSPLYDSYIKTAQDTDDQQIRMDAMSKAQQLLIDEAVILPTYERVISTVQHPQLQGLVFQQTGAQMVLTYARVVE